MKLFFGLLFIGFGLCIYTSCSNKIVDPINPSTLDTNITIVKAVDPKVANTVGFFLDNWQEKSFIEPINTAFTAPTEATTTLTIDASRIIAKIPQQIFGHNANTWMGTFIDTPSFMTDISNLKPNIIRWPSGSGSDGYFWNASPVHTNGREMPSANYLKTWGVPDKLMANDGTLTNASFGYGQTTDNWRASLNNYYEMLRQSNNKGIITVNYAFARYGTSINPVATAAHLAAEWVRYDKGRTQYWEVGNESFGDWEVGYRIDQSQNKDGQPEFLTGKLYAQHFKVFADSMRKAASEIGVQIKIGAVMHEAQAESWQSVYTKTWNSTLIPELNNQADFYIVHNYFTPFAENTNAATILNSAITVPSKMMTYVTGAITQNGGTVKPIAMTEWNMASRGLKQQVSNISGLFSLIVQGEAIKNNYGLAARWDLLNGWDNGNDHGLFSDGGSSDDPRWNPRPSFYYMYYFQKMIGDRLLESTITGKNNTAIKVYSTSYSSGQLNTTLVNTSNSATIVEIKTTNFRVGSMYYWYSLEGGNDNGEFSRKVVVNGNGPKGVAGGPSSYSTLEARSATTSTGIKVIVPAYGAVCLVIDKK